MKKAQGLSMNVIIVAVLALLVLVILSVIFTSDIRNSGTHNIAIGPNTSLDIIDIHHTIVIGDNIEPTENYELTIKTKDFILRTKIDWEEWMDLKHILEDVEIIDIDARDKTYQNAICNNVFDVNLSGSTDINVGMHALEETIYVYKYLKIVETLPDMSIVTGTLSLDYNKSQYQKINMGKTSYVVPIDWTFDDLYSNLEDMK